MKNLIATVVIFLCCVATLRAQNLTSVDFFLQDVEGEDQSFQQYLAEVRDNTGRGKSGVVVLVFWGLCKACKQELKALESVYKAHTAGNLHILAININNTRSIAKVKSYITAQRIPFEVWLDPVSEVFKKLNGQGIPYTLIVDTDGKLLLKQHGFLAGDEKKFEKVIKD
ncbi:TlpA family protein disulfide reductase [bacterium]|nr:TlpA family protein disulfide reductase [bacterium]